jgi:glyoxylase-like metal-dependent hydrolase (beta-lactamase superfamily II)
VAGAGRAPGPGRRGGPLRIPASTPAGLPFDICTAPNASPRTLGGTNTYLVGRPETAVIDPGPEDPAHTARILAACAAAGRRIAVILLTHAHRDHSGGVAALVRATGAPVRGWRTGAPVADGASLAAGGACLCALYTPGHADDHLAFYWPERQVLFSGDLILGEGTVTVSPPGGSMDAYLRSLERVAGLPLAVIAPGHGPVVCEPQARIRQYLDHRRHREAQILALLARGAHTVGALADAIYPALDPGLRAAAEGTVAAHLAKLIGEGRVREAGTKYVLRQQDGEG